MKERKILFFQDYFAIIRTNMNSHRCQDLYSYSHQIFPICFIDIKQNGHVEHEKGLKPVPEYDNTKDSFAQNKENTLQDVPKQSETVMENTNIDTKDNPVYEKDGEVSPTFTIEY